MKRGSWSKDEISEAYKYDTWLKPKEAKKIVKKEQKIVRPKVKRESEAIVKDFTVGKKPKDVLRGIRGGIKYNVPMEYYENSKKIHHDRCIAKHKKFKWYDLLFQYRHAKYKKNKRKETD